MRYPVVIHKDPDSDYGVTVPDYQAASAPGRQWIKPCGNAVEAIECHLEGLMLDGEPLLTPTSVERYKDDEEFSGGVYGRW